MNDRDPSDNVILFGETPPLEDGDEPRRAEPHTPDLVFAAFEDAERRIKAVRTGANPSDLRMLEFDLLKEDFIDIAARHRDYRAVVAALAELRVPSFTGSARLIEKAIAKRRAAITKAEDERQAKIEDIRIATQHRLRREAEASRAKEEDWPRDRKGEYPSVADSLDRAKGIPKATISNLLKIMRDDPRWGSNIRMNQLGSDVEIDGKVAPTEARFLPELAEWIADNYGLQANIELCRSAVWAVAEINAYHPVREYLDTLPAWDGVHRIDRILDEALHAADDPDSIDIRKKYIRCFLISAVARIRKPGCKARSALILIGEQFAGKSTFFEALFSRQWFGDSPLDIGNKDAMMLTRTVWGYEAAELDSFERATSTAVKGFMSSPVDRYRAPYDSAVRSHPRQSVMCGTTNKFQFLSDPTGSSRFHPIPITEGISIDHEWIAAIRDELWSEALHAFEAGEQWYLSQVDDEKRADLSRVHELSDPWDAKIESFMLAHFVTSTIPKGPVQSWQILDLVNVSYDRRSVRDEARVRDILTRIGYRYTTQRNANGTPVRGWYPKKPTEAKSADGKPTEPSRGKPDPVPPEPVEPEQDCAADGDEPPDDDDHFVPIGPDGVVY